MHQTSAADHGIRNSHCIPLTHDRWCLHCCVAIQQAIVRRGEPFICLMQLVLVLWISSSQWSSFVVQQHHLLARSTTRVDQRVPNIVTTLINRSPSPYSNKLAGSQHQVSVRHTRKGRGRHAKEWTVMHVVRWLKDTPTIFEVVVSLFRNTALLPWISHRLECECLWTMTILWLLFRIEDNLLDPAKDFKHHGFGWSN